LSAQRVSYFSLLLQHTENPVAICSSLLLAWVAYADGILSDEERQFLDSAVESLSSDTDKGRREAIVEELLSIAAGNRTSDLVLACKTIRERLHDDEKRAFLDLVIGMIVSDNRMNLSDRYYLEFLSDLLDIVPNELQEAYYNITGKDLPRKGDPSARIWWEVKTGSQSSSSRSNDNIQGEQLRTDEMTALSALGLRAGATQEDIRSAYRRLAMLHHPDRFQTFGEEVVKRAAQKFMQIKLSYDILVKQ
jgi:uncharacterized tellurite resistance protein B-like protein